MLRLSYCTLLATFVLLTASSSRAQDAKGDQEKILGTWNVQSATEDGGDVAYLQKAKFTFEQGGRLTLKINGQNEPTTLRYNLVTEKTKIIEISPPPINEKDKSSGDKDRGLFKIEGDTLTLCIADGPGPDAPAPKDFTAKARYVTLVVLQREKK